MKSRFSSRLRGGLSGVTLLSLPFVSNALMETNLYTFGSSPSDGNHARAVLVQASDGTFYGTTLAGGTNNVGTVFKLVAALPSPANRMNDVTVAGTNVVITIASVAGETYQLQSAADLTSGHWSDVPGVSATN